MRGFTLVELLVVIVIIAALAGLTAPMVMRQRKKADQTEALNNAREIHKALFEFDVEYGSFPDKETQSQVREATESPLAQSGGTSSNDYFRQLLAQGLGNEKMFYAKTADSKKPDDIYNTAARHWLLARLASATSSTIPPPSAPRTTPRSRSW